MSNTGQAWVTLVTNDSYALGALVLAQSLRRNNTIYQLAVLITPGVSAAMRQLLSSTFDLVKEVDVLDSKDAANLALLARPDLGITFTKLHCWNLTQYTKCVFLDADTLVVKNCDELFEREELSAAPDAGWPDCFNSGVFVFKPSEATFKALLDFALKHGSFDGGDQGLLNMFFNEWATKDIEKHLPFIYNMVASATYSYLPAFKVFGSNVKVAHFIGSSKPWLQAQQSPSTLSSFLELWWTIFQEDVAKKLNTDMMINCTVFQQGPRVSWSVSTPPPPSPPPTRHIAQRYEFVDPWDYIQEAQPETGNATLNSEDVIDRLVQHLYETQKQNREQTNDPGISVFSGQNQPTYSKQISVPNLSHESGEARGREAIQTTYSNMLGESRKKAKSLQQLHQQQLQNHHNQDRHTGQLYTQREDVGEPPLRRVDSYENIPEMISPPFSPALSFEHGNSQTNTEEPTPNQEQSGLAGAMAGGQRDIIEDQWRKQSWEQGKIDYLGADAFENIWKKISATVGEAIKPLETPVPIGPEPTSSEAVEAVTASTEVAVGAQPQEVPVKTEDKTEPQPKEAPEAPEQPTPKEAQAPPQPTEAASAPVESVPVLEAPAAPASESSQPAAPLTASAPTVQVTEKSVPAAEPAAKPEAESAAASVPQSPPPQDASALASPAAPVVDQPPVAQDTASTEAIALSQAGPKEEKVEAAETKVQPAPLQAEPAPATQASPPAPSEPIPTPAATSEPLPQATESPATPAPETPVAPASEKPVAPAPVTAVAPASETPAAPTPETAVAPAPETPVAPAPKSPVAPAPEVPAESAPVPELPAKSAPAPEPLVEQPPKSPEESPAALKSPAESPPAPQPSTPISSTVPSPASPAVPSPSSPSGPEGATTASSEPASPLTAPADDATQVAAEAPPQTPTGEAPVPPKRRSTKAKGKK